ncbi:MAG: CRISPR-associated endonuclease Cas1 [Thermaerobacter sp.]|nr:CRISPR-associated endonuclease Cas1 [Thermaerobacter sp.]
MLPLDASPLVPARMLNEFAYCPRLMYLEWVDGEWADSVDTVEGRFVHRRVDQAGGTMPPPGSDTDAIHARSVELSDPQHGLIARMDLVEGDQGTVIPVDYKRGQPPDNRERSWEPERVQLCVQGLILRGHGYRCDRGILYFSATRQRVEVPFDDPLVERTLTLLAEARAAAQGSAPPPALQDSPKCARCSLVGICLPDEVNLLSRTPESPRIQRRSLRLLYPSRPDSLPLYVSEQGAWVGKAGERLVVRKDSQVLAEAKLIDISQLSVFGAVQVSTAVLQELASRDVPVCFLSHGGYFYGTYQGLPRKAAPLRIRQFATAADPQASLPLAREVVRAKILNQRTLLRRNADALPERVVLQLRGLAHHALTAKNTSELLGIEGTAAGLYYAHFRDMFTETTLTDFDFRERNRRPPKDPVNAVLSLGYALLARDLTVTLHAVGLDPYVGIYHHPGHGRPSLALDLMEEFRALIVDSVAIGLFNRHMLTPSDFIARAGAVSLTPSGRKTAIQAYESRMNSEAEHPLFGYRIAYRRTLEVQARLFARVLTG